MTRDLDVPGTFNLRDIGGYPASGGVVRWRTLLRSDALHRIDDRGRAVLAEVGLRTVVDLRALDEAARAPSALDGLGARIEQVPLIRPADREHLPAALDGVYQFVVDERGGAIAAAIAPLCQPDALPAMVHCSAGKDRTGVVIALILAAVGVDDELVAADYALSRRYARGDAGRAARVVRYATGLGDRFVPELLVAPPELILATLERVRSRAGSVGGYLTESGLSACELDALRKRLVGGG